MWLEIRRSKLPQRERDRVTAALAEPPMLAEAAAPPEREGAVSALWLGLLCFALGLSASPHATVFLALGIVAAAYVVRRAYVFRRAARSAWRPGRFLYPWGYVEVEGDVLYLRRGEDLVCSFVRVDDVVVAVRIALRAHPSLAAELPLPAGRDIPEAALQRLHGARFDAGRAGYRTRSGLPRARWIPFRLHELVVDVLVAGLAAATTGALALPFVALAPPPSARTSVDAPPPSVEGTWRAIVPGIGVWPEQVRGAVDLATCDASQAAVASLFSHLTRMEGVAGETRLAEVMQPDTGVAFLRARCAFRVRIGPHGWAGPPHALLVSWRMAGMMTAYGTALDLRQPEFRRCAGAVRDVAPRDRVHAAALAIAQMVIAHDHQVEALEKSIAGAGWPPCLDPIARSLAVETWDVPPE